MKVMIYTFSNTTAWWRYIASQLELATDTVLVSDLPDADIYIIPEFYRNLRKPSVAESALAELGEDNCDEVIARCRLLRTLDRTLALRMIGAMWQTVERLIEEEKPDLFLCFVVDRYILDVFERALARHGIRYVGLAIGVLPDHVMFMAKGEHLPIREPSEAEVDGAIATLAKPEYVPNYVFNKRFNLARFGKLYLHFTARWVVFEIVKLWRRNPLDFRYLSTRWAACGYRVRLRDWAVMSYFQNDWQELLEATPFDRRVFVALSVNPEAAIEYWVNNSNFIDYQNVLERAARAFGAAGFRLFVKDHPSQFGFRQVDLFRALSKYDCVTFVPYEVPGQLLINNCKATFTWTGTVGLQAAMAGRCAIVESGTYYIVEGLFVVLRDLDDLDDLPRRIKEFTPSMELIAARRALARHFLRSSLPGSYLSWRNFSPHNPDDVQRVRSLIDSLNRYLPALAKSQVPGREELRAHVGSPARAGG